MQKYSPLVESKKYKRRVPILDAWADLQELLNRDNPKAKEYKEKLLGNTQIVDAPSIYWDTSLFLSLEGAVDYQTWVSLPIHERAKLRAMVQLRNIAQTLDQYEKDMAEERKKVFSKNGNKVDA